MMMNGPTLLFRNGVLPASLFLLLLFTSSPSLAALGWPGTDQEGRPCSGPPSNYGPFDYTDHFARSKKLGIVEQYHFTPQIRNLALTNRKSLFDNIGYTLRAFPNHHPALYAMMRLHLLESRTYGPPLECYFNRAKAINPTDGTIYLLEGIYFHRLKEFDNALDRYRTAEKLGKKSAELYYNMGLLYLDMGENDKALEYARKAYKRGYPLKGLKQRLSKMGLKL